MSTNWTCKLTSEDGKDLASLQVGTRFLMNCAGPDLQNDPTAEFAIVLPEAQKYALRGIEFHKATRSFAEMMVVSHQAGKHHITGAQLVSGSQRVDLGPIDLEVETSIDPLTNPKGEPNPPYGPFYVLPGLFFWSILAALILLPIGVGLRSWRRRARARRVMARVRELSGPSAPFLQFMKEVRVASRKAGIESAAQISPEVARVFVESVELGFLLYVSRKFQIPGLDLRPSELVKLLKRSAALDPELLKEIFQTLSEIENFKKKSDAVQPRDLRHSIERMTLWCDTVESRKEHLA